MGKMLFDQIAALLQSHYDIPTELIQIECQKEFRRSFPHFQEYFPELTYQYTSHTIEEAQCRYECTGHAPKWRPPK